MFVEIREPHTNKLLFKYDPVRDLIEIQRRGQKTLIDLSWYRERYKQAAQKKPAE